MAGIIIAGTHSATGKTTVTMGLLRAFKNQGIRVAAAKVGPDYIDPAFHRIASGNDCYNIDLWAMRNSTVDGILHHLQCQSDIVVIEGAMGLFDGAADGGGSTADVACLTRYPIILVVDCAKHSTSVAAVVQGFDTLVPDVRIAGVILNKVGSKKHRHMLTQSLTTYVPHIPIMGVMDTNTHIQLPSRHLGLVQGVEHESLNRLLDTLADMCIKNIDVSAVSRCADTVQSFIPPTPFPMYPPLGTHIAISRDAAFQFLYPHVCKAWQQAGAVISYFSPLHNQAPHPDADAVYLCGGYPELHLPSLAQAHTFKTAIRQAVANNIPVYGECGGYMVMGRAIIGADKVRYDMIGVLDHTTDFSRTQRTLCYQTARAIHPPHPAFDASMQGHRFHYATVKTSPKTPFIRAQNTYGTESVVDGGVQGSAYGSFFHMIDYHPQNG